MKALFRKNLKRIDFTPEGGREPKLEGKRIWLFYRESNNSLYLLTREDGIPVVNNSIQMDDSLVAMLKSKFSITRNQKFQVSSRVEKLEGKKLLKLKFLN